MFKQKNHLSTKSKSYQVVVEGKIESSWSEWLGSIQLESRSEADGVQLTTLSRVIVDQAGLRGLLNRLWDLNLVIRSVRQVGSENNSSSK